MRKILILLILVGLSESAYNQLLTLDAVYDSASVYTQPTPRYFMYIRLDSNKYKYALLNPRESKFTLYNLNHSVYKKVNIPTQWSTSNIYFISYISTSLIDCDTSNLEYILCVVGDGVVQTYPKKVLIYRENGVLLQTIDSCTFLNNATGDGVRYGPEYTKPIINTPNGTKLIIRNLNQDVQIYSMCGKVFENVEESQSRQLTPPYPNPTRTTITIPYRLPQGNSEGQLLLHDMSGKLINSYKVDDTFDELIISMDKLPAGTYYYFIRTNNQSTSGKKIIKVN